MDFKEINIPIPLWDLLDSCVECIPSCCDLDAFYVDEPHIRKWVQKSELKQLEIALDQFVAITKEVQQSTLPIGCDQLGFWGTYHAEPQKLIEYFSDWEAEIKSVIADSNENLCAAPPQ